jgi:hypothetical protein
MSPINEILLCALAAHGLANTYDDMGAAALAAKLETIAEFLSHLNKTNLKDDSTAHADHLQEA